MKSIKYLYASSILLISSILAFGLASSQAQSSTPRETNLAIFRPETVGFSSVRLERLHKLMQDTVDKKQIAGIVTILARHGKVIDYRTYGQRDIASGSPMSKDVIFRDYSMTKPVTGVAMMILFEQGKWLPMDPIAKYVPEFAHLKVFKGVDSNGKMILADPEHPPTMRELMTHSAGFTYGVFGNTPVDAMYRDSNILQSKNLQEMINKLAKIPLLYEPGKGWTYSVSMDIEGYIVEKLSGQSLPDFMRDNIFVPLHMKDAGFFVPQEKRKRFSTYYRTGPQGELVADSTDNGIPIDYASQPTMPSGGGGMVSTADDYYRFAEMLAGQGTLNGVRILAPSSVRLMTSNHLPPDLLTGEFHIGLQVMRPGLGYGYNCAVAFDPAEANLPDGKGTFFWDGAGATWFWVDPTNDIVFVGMVQRMLGAGSPNLEYLSRSFVYQALVEPAR